MQKVIALILFLVITTLAAGGYLSWQVSELYQQTQSEALREINHSLNSHNMQLACTTQTEWLGLVRNDNCTLARLNRPLVLLEFWQKILITPLWVQGDFGVNPEKGFAIDFFDLKPLFQTQLGHWRLPYGSQQIEFSYQTGSLNNTSMPSTEIVITPLRFIGSINISAPYKSEVRLQLSELKFEQLSQKVLLQNLDLQAISLQKQQVRFIERTEVSFNHFEVASAGRSLSVSHLSAKQANMLDGNKLASLNNIEFEGLRIHSEESDIRFNANKLHLFLDNLEWSSLQQLSSKTKIDKLPSSVDFESLLAGGMLASLDKLETDFIYQDRTSALLGASGDIKLNGNLRLLAAAKQKPTSSIEQRVKAKFNLSLSDSLMLGPHAGLMMDFIDEGWLYQQRKRLVGNIHYANGKLLSNGNLVSSLALFPVFEEDH